MIKISEKDQATLERSIRTYKGRVATLETALGALVVGQVYGWRVLRMAHTNQSWDKYENILGLKFKLVCPEYTDLSDRCFGIRMAKKLGGFWKVAQGKGDVPAAGKGLLS